MIVDERDCLVECVDTYHGQDGAEYLFLVHAHVTGCMVKQCGSEEIAGRFCDVVRSAVDHNPGALFFTNIDVGMYLVIMFLRNQWTHIVAVVRARPDLQCCDLRPELLEQRLR